mmetsp:Transcript_44778/g.140408  ORF Transcript_44778/g.140408 Transcript_44778/m.140408 type:complete len:151 (-) Transcript_44778:531-983(-)
MIHSLGLYSWPAIFLSLVSITTFLLSVNYWRNGVKGMRRDVDVIFAKVSFLTHCVTAALYQEDTAAAVIAWALGAASYGLFMLASKLWKVRTRTWVLGHAAFHCCVGLNMMMCVLAMERPYLEKTLIRSTNFAFLEHLTAGLQSLMNGLV